MSGRYLTWIHVLVLLYIYSGEAYGCANQAPTAAIGNTNPQYSCRHRPVGFYSESEGPDGSIVLHEWDFPPGASEVSGTWLTEDNCSSGECEVSLLPVCADVTAMRQIACSLVMVYIR